MSVVTDPGGWTMEGWLTTFEQNVEAHVQGVLRLCREARAGDDSTWDEVLRSHGAEPDPLLARVVASRDSSAPRGASPDELRRVLDVVATRALAELSAFASHAPAARALPVFARVTARLSSMAVSESNQHRESLASARSGLPQAPPAVGGIFANAQATAAQTPWAHSYGQGAQANTLTCGHCGGAQERPLDFLCRYCRRPIAGPAQP